MINNKRFGSWDKCSTWGNASEDSYIVGKSKEWLFSVVSSYLVSIVEMSIERFCKPLAH